MERKKTEAIAATNLTVDDIETLGRFYSDLVPHDEVKRGVFASIPYLALLRDGEVEVCLFEKSENNPLTASFPTVMVDSVAEYEQKVQDMGGQVLIPTNTCPCTGAPFAVCVDAKGNQFMIKEPRT